MKPTRYDVQKLMDKGYSDSRIKRELHISTTSFGAYKAHITRNKDKEDSRESLNGLGRYMGDNIVLTSSQVRNLNSRERSQLLRILEKAQHSESVESVRDQVRRLKHNGHSNDEIYSLFPKRMRSSLTAYIAHYTRGSYAN